MQSEVLTLQCRQVDLDAGAMRLDPGTTKNDDGRIVYLTPELKALLSAQVERVHALERQLGRVIPHLFPHLHRRRGERIVDVRKALVIACTRAKVTGMLRHDLRRTAVGNLERAGVPRSHAMKMTGHKTEGVHNRYAIVSDADLRDATARLTGMIPGITATATVESRSATARRSSEAAV
jgi:integrase